MSLRPTTDHDRLALKRAVRQLLRASGGQASAAEVTRVGQPALSRYGSRHHEDQMPVDVLADLTIDADDPVVVRELCRLANGAFVPMRRKGGHGDLCVRGVWGAEIAAAVREGGEATAKLCTALADNGKVDPHEIRDMDLIRELHESIEAQVVLLHHCEQVMREDEE
ncbi:hypothetical protein [Roseibium algae]|uniref:Uncharacterized protein n=1 Tax=Roseibium algae TaxID=3123038 RepID=A0ABU8TK06_9HYPH